MAAKSDGLLVRPWRQAFEVKAMFAWMAAAGYQIAFPLLGAPSVPALLAGIGSSGMAFLAGLRAHQVWERRLMLFGSNLLFMSMDDFNDRVDANPEGLYLGEGWEWTPDHTQWVYDLMRENVADLAPPGWYVSIYNKIKCTNFVIHSEEDEVRVQQQRIDALREAKKEAAKRNIPVTEVMKTRHVSTHERYRGLAWIHGMSLSRPIYFPVVDTKGNTLIAGTTRSGKTVLYRALTRQLIRRGECLVVIDPKGDLDLLNIMLEGCYEEDRMEDFVFFHPAFPEYCHRIDPFASYQQPSQLASRVEPLIPSSSPGGDSFSKFAWGAMESILSAMDMLNIKPSLMSLRGTIEKGPDSLLYDCIIRHCDLLGVENYHKQIQDYEKNLTKRQETGDPKVKAAAQFYKEVVKEIKAAPAIDGLIGFYEHNREHAGKMLASLMPVLKSLTTGPLASLLSPDGGDEQDHRPMLSFDSIIKQKRVCYIGLDAMADPAVAKAIGSIFCSDFVACAASRYTHGGSGDHTVNLLIDELSNAINVSVIELLNKGAGAGFRVFGATQTTPDLQDALGESSTKDKTLGNFNNLISLRIIDSETKEFVASQMGEVSVRTAQISQNTQSLGSDNNPILYSGGYGTRTTDSAAPMIDPAIMNKLPDLEFIAQLSAGRVIKGRLPLLVAGSGGRKQVTLDDMPWVKRMRGVA